MLNITGKLKNSYTLESEDLVLERKNSQKLPDTDRRSSLKGHALKKSVSVDVEDVMLQSMLSTSIEKYNHLLVGKVRDTQMMFSFIVEASIIEVDQSQLQAVSQ